MFEDLIGDIKDICLTKDQKICNRLSVEQFGNMMCVMSDKGIVDASDTSIGIKKMIIETHQQLMQLFELGDFSRKIIRNYQKKYNLLLVAVKNAYDLEPVGSIQNRLMAVGLAIGVGVGSALSTVIPAMISIGIALGLVMGISIGKKKEKEAEEAGKLF